MTKQRELFFWAGQYGDRTPPPNPLPMRWRGGEAVLPSLNF